jgi:SAM-dependent methyltransferase
MTQAPPTLFDRKAIARNRTRAQARPDRPDWLDHSTAQEILWRLDVTLRHFPRLLLVNAPSELAQAIRASGKAGHVFEADIATKQGALCITPEALPFAPASLDAVIWANGLELVNDVPGTLIQIRRALKPDGLFLACVWAGNTLQELRESFLAAESETGGASPRVAPFGEIRVWGGLLSRAGLALPVADLDRLDVTYGDALTLMRELKHMGLANPLQARRKSFTPRQLLARAAMYYAENFAENGRLRATFERVTLTGWAPDESQQKPLAPGSAKTRLAEALNTREHKL